MSLVAAVTKAKPSAPMILINGFPGAGKTSLAGLFPNPIFIQAEKASTVFEVMPEDQQPSFMSQLPASDTQRMTSTKATVREQLLELATVDHPYKTVVFDTVTSLNDLIEKEVVEFDDKGADSIGNAAGGYHKGYDVSAGHHADIIRMCKHLTNKGIAIVFLAHIGVHKMKNRPDESAEYSVYATGMHEKSRALYVKHSDAVLYLKSRQFVSGQESDKKGNQTKMGRILDTGERVLICSSDGTVGYVDAKNRYNMPQEIDCPQGENPILQYMPFFASQPTTTNNTSE